MPRLGNTIAVGAAVLLATGVLATVPADATVSPYATCFDWGTTGTAGDIVGAYTHGKKCELDDGRVQIDVIIDDTAGDTYAACAQLHATYADGGTRDEWVYIAGDGTPPKSKSLVYASSVRSIWVREGLGNDGSCNTMADGVHTIWS
jgi:hypothetical protein